MRIPDADWAIDLGNCSEDDKAAVLGDAAALVQLSTQESLSLVVLEASAQGTPVIIAHDCVVLRGQIEHSGGGVAVADYASFAQALDDLAANPRHWRDLGRRGAAYVHEHYADEGAFRNRLLQAIEELAVPLKDMMRRRGLARAARRDVRPWRERMAAAVEAILDAAPRRPGTKSTSCHNWPNAARPPACAACLCLCASATRGLCRAWWRGRDKRGS